MRISSQADRCAAQMVVRPMNWPGRAGCGKRGTRIWRRVGGVEEEEERGEEERLVWKRLRMWVGWRVLQTE